MYDKEKILQVLHKYAMDEGLRGSSPIDEADLETLGCKDYADLVCKLVFAYQTLQPLGYRGNCVRDCLVMLGLLREAEVVNSYANRLAHNAHLSGMYSTTMLEERWRQGADVLATNFEGLMLLYQADKLVKDTKTDKALMQEMADYVRSSLLNAAQHSN